MLSRTFVRRIIPVAYQAIKTSAAPQFSRRAILSISRSSSTRNGAAPRQYSQQSSEELPVVDFDYVQRASSMGNVMIVDVREPDEIKDHGKIPNSINIPLGSVNATLALSEEDFQETYKRAKPKENTEIIFYCMIGKRSEKAQRSALSLGYKNAKNYLGSWIDWATKSQ